MKTRQIVLLGIIFALMITFLIFIPLNAIVPLIALIVIAETENIKLAGLGGLLFGVSSFAAALFFPSTPLYVIFLNPIVSIIPRIIVGLMVFLIYKGIFKLLSNKFKTDINDTNNINRRKIRKLQYVSLTIGAISGAIINTTLVMGTIFLFYTNKTYTLNDVSILVRPEVLLPLIAVSAILEPIFCALIAPPIVIALKHSKINS